MAAWPRVPVALLDVLQIHGRGRQRSIAFGLDEVAPHGYGCHEYDEE
jgi:hypothetical protein